MAYTEALNPGVPLVVAQSTWYALPPGRNFLQSTDAVELGVTTTAGVLVASSTTGLETGAAFVRCTTSTTCSVIVRKF